jgi:hypothetical protein
VDLEHGHWFHLFLATFQIFDPYFALSMLATVLALVGACEYRLGTVRTVAVYALAQITGVMAMIVIAKQFASTGSRWGAMLVSGHNLGASAGAVGAMGAWLMAFPRPLRTWSIALCAAFLLAAFGGDVHPWDVEHLAAFMLGLGMGAWFDRGRRPRGGVHKFNIRPGTRADRLTALAWSGAIVGLFCVLAPLALVDGMPTAEWLARMTASGLDIMRWVLLTVGGVLLATAPCVGRGDKRAHGVYFAALAITCVALWQPGAPGVEHLLSVLTIVGLQMWRSDFDHRRAVAGARAGAMLLVCTIAFVLFGFVALREHFVPPLNGAGALHVALLRLRFLPIPTPNWYSPGAIWFLHALPYVTYAGTLLSIPMFVRSGISGKEGSRAGSAG